MRRKERPKPVIHSLDEAVDWLRRNSIGCEHIITFLEDAKCQGYELLPTQASCEMEETAERYMLGCGREEFTWGDAWERMVATARYWREVDARQDETLSVSNG